MCIRDRAGAAGKVFKLEAKVGDAVKKGDTLLILEIMKMEMCIRDRCGAGRWHVLPL